MYPAVRDIKAALRWVHANAAHYGGDPTSSLTIQGGSAGATACIALALAGGDDQTFANDYTNKLAGLDTTLNTTNLDQKATVTGLIDFWGGLFAEDAMYTKDDVLRWTNTSAPTIAFHGTEDTTVAPESGNVLCGNLTALGVPCEKVVLPGEAHGCWSATVELPDSTEETIYQYAFDWMANTSGWAVL